MKDPEYVRSANKTNWMDNSVISTKPSKITIIDPRLYTSAIMDILHNLDSITEIEMQEKELEHMAKSAVRSIMSGIIAGRRAWINGYNAEHAVAVWNLTKIFTFDINGEVRDRLRYELDFDLDPITKDIVERGPKTTVAPRAAQRLRKVIDEIGNLMNLHMSPNHFVIHELSIARDGRVFWLEEFSDWRVLEWTKDQQRQIDERHENI